MSYTYSVVGDIIALAVCVVNLVLLRSSYRLKQKSLRIYLLAVGGIITAAIPNIAYHMMLEHITVGNRLAIVELRDLSHILLTFVFCLFIFYISNLLEVEKKWNLHLHVISCGAGILCSVLMILEQVFSFGYYISSDLQVHVDSPDVYYYAYGFYTILFFVIMIRHRRKMITHMYWCLVNVFIFTLAMFAIMILRGDTSYSVFTYSLLLTALLFLFHHNPFDKETGTLNARAFMSYLDELRGEDFSIIHLYLRDMTMDKVFIMSEELYHFNEKYFRNPLTFRMRDNKMLMVCRHKQNPEVKEKKIALLKEFEQLYEKYGQDYRIVMLENFPEIKSGAEYYELIEFVEAGMENNTVYHCTQRDVDNFMKQKYVEDELLDIYRKGNLDDERVLVYCQPVLNAISGKFTTAEALMRLELSRTGLVYPDNFIPIAEKNDYIHALSRIILNKTCKEIHALMEEGYDIHRVSVNFSVQELHRSSFCDEVIHIIEKNDIPYDKIAIELTESRNEQDFEMMRKTMLRLQRYGIRFYLDDFGTGYSNFERIIGLPIDIIKFDRSMTILSAKDEASQYMVGAFSNIFKKSDYQVLFEGVEDEKDESRCKEMQAVYLQGYKYSRPIPIGVLREFLEKTDENK